VESFTTDAVRIKDWFAPTTPSLGTTTLPLKDVEDVEHTNSPGDTTADARLALTLTVTNALGTGGVAQLTVKVVGVPSTRVSLLESRVTAGTSSSVTLSSTVTGWAVKAASTDAVDDTENTT
jgi:hypothetical protein